MKPVRVRSVSQSNSQSAEIRKLDYLAAIAAVLTLLAAIIGVYIAFKNLLNDSDTTVISI